MKAVLLILILGLTGGAAAGQIPSFSHPMTPDRQGFFLRGMISGDQAAHSLSVQLVPGNPMTTEKVDVHPDGTFEFQSAVPGTHQLVVTASNGEVLYDDYVHINGSTDFLTVRLRPTPSTSASHEKTVSIQQLQHHVSGEAAQAFSKAKRAQAKGETEEARRLLHRALEIDPEFADAHNELGVMSVSAGNLADASDEFQRAIDLCPDHAVALANLSIVLGKMEHYDEASSVATRALRVDPSNAKVHFILAISLMRNRKDSTAALSHLDQAAPEIPLAHVFAADLLNQTGRPDEALTHLETYLRGASPNDPYRARVEASIQAMTREGVQSDSR